MTVTAETSPVPQTHTLKDISGYIENAFPGKQAQMVQVTEYLSEKAFIPAALAENEVSWFYGYVPCSLPFVLRMTVVNIANSILHWASSSFLFVCLVI